MSWLTPKLKHRIIVKEGKLTPNDDGGFDTEYTDLVTVWAGMSEQSDFMRAMQGSSAKSEYTRGVQTEDTIETHSFIVRRVAVKSLGASFTNAFSTGFDSIEDLNPLKSQYFVFLKSGSATKGRRFRIRRIKLDDKHKEYIMFKATEIEESGTGYGD